MSGGGGIVKPDLSSWDWYWKLDDASGTTAANSGAKTGLDGTLYNLSGGLPLWETDADLGGSCLNFGDGATYNMVRSSVYPANFRPSSIMSIVCAVKCRSLGGAGLYPYLVTMGDYVGSLDRNGWYTGVSTSGDGLLFATTCNGGSGQTSHGVSHASAGISADVAFLFGWVKNGTVSKIYINGTQIGADGSAQSSIGYRTTTESISIGHSSDPSAWTSSVYGLEGKIGFAAGVATDQSANMLSIAQAAGFA